MAYIRKNHLTINEETEIWEVVSDVTGKAVWFGTAEQLTEVLGYDDWEAGDTCH